MSATRTRPQRMENRMDGKPVTVCPECGTRYRVSLKHAGSNVACRKCGVEFTIIFDPALEADAENSDGAGSGSQDISWDDSLMVLGKLAVKFDMATPKQVDEALAHKQERAEQGEQLNLGDILVARDVIDPNQLGFLLSVQSMKQTQSQDRRFGMIAMKNRFATVQDIEEALAVQKEAFLRDREILRLGEILVDRGVISQQQCDAILLRQKALGEVAADAPEMGSRGPEAEIVVSGDRMRAELVCPKGYAGNLTIRTVRELLARAGVVHGVLSDDRLGSVIESAGRSPGPFTVALGDEPRVPAGESVDFNFDTDPLRFGIYRDGGVIDFRKCQLVDMVRPGDLLATKVPGHRAADGRDVLGQSIPAPERAVRPVAPVPFAAGAGTRLAKGGAAIEAEREGRPEVAWDGSIVVRKELVIGGDVGPDTGNVVYEGGIVVEGNVRTGYRVEGGRLVCQDIGSADIDVDGDVVVLGGIQGATVKAGGSVRARYVRGATVLALGDVMVEQEVRDSRIEAAGACVLGTGKIVASGVYAKAGVEAGQVGARNGGPCTIVMGTNARIENESGRIGERIAEKNGRIAQLKEQVSVRDQQGHKLQKQIGKLSSLQDKNTRDRKLIEEDLAREPDEAARSRLERRLWDVKQHLEETNRILADLYNEQDELAEKTASKQRDIRRAEEEIVELEAAREALVAWAEKTPGEPVLRAYGIIHPKTTIQGPHATLTVEEGLSRVQIRETLAAGGHEMRIVRML